MLTTGDSTMQTGSGTPLPTEEGDVAEKKKKKSSSSKTKESSSKSTESKSAGKVQNMQPFGGSSIAVYRHGTCILTLIVHTDPFADADDFATQDSLDKSTKAPDYVHIRIQQRNGRKTLTTVQGIPDEYDPKKLLKHFKKEFACNGTLVEDEELGQVIQLQGDQRAKISQMLIDDVELRTPYAFPSRYRLIRLTRNRFAARETIKIHGF